MLYLNSEYPNILWSGEQGNENFHQDMNAFSLKRGKEGFLRAYIRKFLCEIKWDTRIYYMYKTNNCLLKKCGFSTGLWREIEDIVSAQQSCKHIIETIRDKGLYCFENEQEKLKQYFASIAQDESLEMKKSENPFLPNLAETVLKFCIEHRHPNTCFINKNKLPTLKQMFYHDYTDEYLIKRCCDWGFIVR